MSTPEDAGGAPPGSAPAGWRVHIKKYWKYWVPILTTVIVIPFVTFARDSVVHEVRKIFGLENYLSVEVNIPSPSNTCAGGMGWVFEQNPQQLPVPALNGDLDNWARSNNGIPASGNYIEVTLKPLNGHRITVLKDGIKVNTTRTEPPRGAYAPFTPGGCGGFLPYGFRLNLDNNPVSVTAKPDEGVLVDVPGGVPRQVALPHEIASGQTEVWDLYAETDKYACEWTATLEWTADDDSGLHTTVITDGDKPFRVTTAKHATVVNPDMHGGWV